MQSILGKPIADRLLQSVAERIRSHSVKPGLAVILVGDDPASEIYVRLKERAAQSVGMRFEKHVLPPTVSTGEVCALVHALNGRSDIHGIIVQLPLPVGIDTDAVIAAIDPAKDADGFHPETVAQFLVGQSSVPPVFPRAILALIQSTGVSLDGKRAIIFANSDLFSQIMSVALGRFGIQSETSLGMNAEEIDTQLRRADIVISAKGDPHFLTGDRVNSGAIVIDGGITRVGERVMSDADPATFQEMGGFITPVPGGVGPVTVAFLISRVTELALGEKKRGEYTRNMKLAQKKLKGSVLGFSLMLLSLLLLSGITLVSVSVLERKASFSTQKSVIAFQAADSAAERVLKRIYINDSPTIASGSMPDDGTLNTLANNLSSVSGGNCSGGVVSGSNTNSPVSASPNYTFQVTFYDTNGATINCSATNWRDRVIRIRSEGFYQRTSRVIEIGIRPRE